MMHCVGIEVCCEMEDRKSSRLKTCQRWEATGYRRECECGRTM
jgi:hypothetical protein